MKSFISFISYISEAQAIKSAGLSAERHTKQYIAPYLPGGSQHSEGTHKIKTNTGSFSAGDKVTLHSHHINDKGIHHVEVSKMGSSEKTIIPTSKLEKPKESKNRGLANEATLINHLRDKHNLMKAGSTGAGSTGGNDFHLLDKRGNKEKLIHGTEGIQGEHKSDIKSTAFGQIELHRHPKTGKWHIPDTSRVKRPEFASHVDNAEITVDGKKKKLLDHLNDTQHSGYKIPAGRTKAEDIHSDKTTTSPAHAYMRDHHVDVVHLDSHGTYRAGNSETHDRHKLGLPSLEGEGRFRVRQKRDNENRRTVQFTINKLNHKSNVHIGTDEGANHIKTILGH